LWKGNFQKWINNQANQPLLSTHCVFIDPPWGGYSYKDRNQINELYLDTEPDCNDYGTNRTISLTSILTEIFNLGAKLVGLKLPLNFNTQIYSEQFNQSKKKVTKCFTWERQIFFMIAQTD